MRRSPASGATVRTRTAHRMTLWRSRSAVCSASSSTRSRRKPAGPTLSDNITGFYAAYGILGALHERERTGKGRRIETSMLEATIAFAPDAFINHKRYGTKVGPLTRVSASQSYVLRCRRRSANRDSSVVPDEILGGPCSTRWNARPRHRRALRQPREADRKLHPLRTELGTTFATRPRAEWAQRLEAEDVPYAPVHNVDEVIDDDQVRHLDTFYQRSILKKAKSGASIRQSLSMESGLARCVPRRYSASTGADPGELGLDRDEITKLKTAKVV